MSGEFQQAKLKNGLKYILFKINDLANFLLNIKEFFPDLYLPKENISISEKTQGILLRVEDDDSIRLYIDEKLSLNPNIDILSLISDCMNDFGEFYHKMKLKDWYRMLSNYLKEKEASYSSDASDNDTSMVADPNS